MNALQMDLKFPTKNNEALGYTITTALLIQRLTARFQDQSTKDG